MHARDWNELVPDRDDASATPFQKEKVETVLLLLLHPAPLRTLREAGVGKEGPCLWSA